MKVSYLVIQRRPTCEIEEAIHVRFNDYKPTKKLSKLEDSISFDM